MSRHRAVSFAAAIGSLLLTTATSAGLPLESVEVRVAQASCASDDGERPSNTFDLGPLDTATVYFTLAADVAAVTRDDPRGLAGAITGFPPPLRDAIQSAGFAGVDVTFLGWREAAAALQVERRVLSWDEFRSDWSERPPQSGRVRVLPVGEWLLLEGSGALPDVCVCVASPSAPPPGGELDAREPLPPIQSFPRVAGEAPPRGRPTLLEFWASWCQPCIDEMPDVVALAREHPDIRVLLVSVDEDEHALRRAMRDLEGDSLVVHDAERAWARRYFVASYPTRVLLASDGREIGRMVGSQSPGARERLDSWLHDRLTEGRP